MTKSVLLSEAGPGDVVKVMRFIKKSLAQPGCVLPHGVENNLIQWVTEVIAKGFACVATIEGRLIGTVGCSVEPYPWNCARERLMQQWFYVHPQYRIFPVAENLSRKVMDKAGEFSLDVFLDVGINAKTGGVRFAPPAGLMQYQSSYVFVQGKGNYEPGSGISEGDSE